MASKSKTSRKLANIDVATEGKEFVPSKDIAEYHDHDGLLGVLNLAVSQDMPVLIIGETGTGKTSAIRYLAAQYNAPFRRVNLNGGTTADELVGRVLLNKEGTYWVDGVLTDAMRKGHWIDLDEINAAGADVLFVLHSLLDDDRMIVLTENGGEVVKPHPAFRLFATANPSGDYAGTRELNKALVSRFPFVLTSAFPSKNERETMIVMERTGLNADLASAIVRVAAGAREAHGKGAMDLVFSLRDILNVARIAQCLGGDAKAIKSAIKVSIIGKSNKEDAAAIADLVKLHFPAQQDDQDKAAVKAKDDKKAAVPF